MIYLKTHHNKPTLQTYRKVLKSPTSFSHFYNEYGPFKYLIHKPDTGECFADDYMKLDEWIFSNSLKSIVREYFQWDTNKLKLRYLEPSNQEKKLHGDDIEGDWDLGNDNLSTPFEYIPWASNPFRTPNKAMQEDEAEIEFYSCFMHCTPTEIDINTFTPSKEFDNSLNQAHLEEYIKTWLIDN